MVDTSLGTILIVDDQDAKRHAIGKILRKAGYQITEASTGSEALRLSADRPGLIVLDVKLPDISGFEVCRRIKENPATSSIPVLHISTTFVDVEYRVHGLEGGADGYLTDVLEPIELIATVKALIRARKAEEAVVDQSRQWQITFDAVRDGVLLLDHEGRIVQVNQGMERIVDKSWDELSGREIDEFLDIPPKGRKSLLMRVVGSGRREIVEVFRFGRWLRATVDPIFDGESGQARGGLCIVSDITDRKGMEDELRRRAESLAAADKRKDEFLAMLAHELRNPLAPIRNSLEVIRLNRDDPGATTEALEIAGRQVAHMARLLDDLLDVSRFTRGNIELRRAPVELSTILNDSVETARPLIEASGHRFLTRFPTQAAWIDGDRTRLSQVVANLLNNAAKYTNRGGLIELEAELRGDEVVIRVRDNGIGLSDEMLPRVFDLFTQETRSLDRSQGGLGIGLTLVRSLVHLHGGTVGASSRGEGLGSEFVVRLPLMAHTPAANPSAREAAPPPPERSLRVLVVDDSDDSARSLARVLKLWGHKVWIVFDGPTAIETITLERFDVIILDIGLPGMDGYRVAELIREQSLAVNSTLVALTGYGQESDFLRSKQAGFDFHLVKPVSVEQMSEVLKHCNPASP